MEHDNATTVEQKSSNDKLKLHDGELVVWSRGGIYQARVYVGDRRYVVTSLKTRDRAEALKSAERYYYKTRLAQEDGLAVGTRSFASVLREYVAVRRTQYETGVPMDTETQHRPAISGHMMRQIERVSKFWLEYAGNRPVSAMDNRALREYVSWRREYYQRRLDAGQSVHPNASIVPADKTLMWEVTLARTVLAWAKERGYLGRAELPTYRPKVRTVGVRPAMEVSDLSRLFRVLRERIKDADNPVARYHRELLFNYVNILVGTGIRVGEANSLRVDDVVEFEDSQGRRNFMLKVRGKTGERVVIPRVQTTRYIDRAGAAYFKLQSHMSKHPEDQSWIRGAGYQPVDWNNWTETGTFFKMADGSPVKSLLPQFTTALQEAGLLVDREGRPYNLYSLRHTYAVQMLRKGVPVWTVSRNMGTGVDMIVQHYGKSATAASTAAELGN